MNSSAILACAIVLGLPAASAAQADPGWFGKPLPPVFKRATAAAPPAPLRVEISESPDCTGCPKRRPVLAVAEALGVNVIYNAANLVIKPAEERIFFKTYPKTWWSNMTYGFEWDDNTFQVNQFGHPYQGNNYFNAGRANGLSFWESAPLAALGSLTWEYMGERHRPSLNDFVMTTVGGIALGEMTHRVAWLIRDPSARGKTRFFRELGAMAIDPVTGLNRIATGDWGRAAEKPAAFVPDTLSGSIDAGVLWRGKDTSFRNASGDPFVQIRLGYGDTTSGRSRQPFDAFTMDLRLGGGGAISEAAVSGRLFGRPIGTSPEGRGRSTYFSINQTYDYHSNTAFQYGGQGISSTVTHRRPLGQDHGVFAKGSAVLVMLGAMDSLYVASVDRQYDFGSGLGYVVAAGLTRKRDPLVRASYTGLWLHTLDGAQVDHVTHALRLDLIAPVTRQFSIGTTGEFIRRKSYYDVLDDLAQKFPQIRVYVSWRQ